VIAVDTSALMAILLDEPEAEACMDVLQATEALAISAGTVAEALIVAERRNLRPEMRRMVEGLGFEVASVTAGTARRMADAHARWGKGIHPAGLNFGDCFAYVLAIERDAPLLYVGEDFSRTDVRPAR
jgi:ribonuclease VapC